MSLAVAVMSLTLAGSASATDWQYERDVNPMTSEVTDTFARLENPNAPYGAIIVANRKDGGIDAGVVFNAASVDCPKICRILVRADEAPPKQFDVQNASNKLFFRDPAAFIDYIRTARRVRVQVRFQNEPQNRFKGEMVATFLAESPLVVHPLRRGVGQ